MDRTDVYILIGDCLRAANVTRETMPYVIGMADVTVDRYYSTSTWSLPSHASLYSISDAIDHEQESIDGRLERSQAVLPKLARQNGYATSLFSENSVFGPFRGFDNYIDYCNSEINFKVFPSTFSPVQYATHLRPEEVVKNGFSPSLTWAGAIATSWLRHPGRIRNAINLAYGVTKRVASSDPTEYAHHGDRVADHVLRYLGSLGERSRPQLCFVNFFDPHNPHHSPPPPEGANPLDLEVTPEESRALASVSAMDVMLSDPELPDSVASEFSSWDDVYARQEEIYEGQIRYTDWLVERLVTGASDRFDDALVVFLGDHGHLFYEEGLVGHHSSLHPGGIRVPLFISLPRSWSRSTRTVDGPLSHVDLSRAISKVLVGDVRTSDEFVDELTDCEEVVAVGNGLNWDTRELYEKYDSDAVDRLASKRVGIIRDDTMIEYERPWNSSEVTKTEHSITERSREVRDRVTGVSSFEDERIEDWIAQEG